MSGISIPSDYDLGYADGLRDGVRPAVDQFESYMQSATGRDGYEDGYVEGYLDCEDDELRMVVGFLPRVRARLLARAGESIGPFRRLP